MQWPMSANAIQSRHPHFAGGPAEVLLADFILWMAHCRRPALREWLDIEFVPDLELTPEGVVLHGSGQYVRH